MEEPHHIKPHFTFIILALFILGTLIISVSVYKKSRTKQLPSKPRTTDLRPWPLKYALRVCHSTSPYLRTGLSVVLGKTSQLSSTTSPTPISTDSNESNDSTANWETYTDELNKFQLQHPKTQDSYFRESDIYVHQVNPYFEFNL